MSSISDLLTTTVGQQLSLLGGPLDRLPLTSIHIIEDTQELTPAAKGGLAVLPPRASLAVTAVGGYQLDVLIRQAAAHGLRGVAIAYQDELVSPTALAIADRYQVTVLGYRDPTPLSDLVLGLAREIAGGAEQMMSRLAQAASQAMDLVVSGRGTEDIIQAVSDLTGVRLVAADPESRDSDGVVSVVDGADPLPPGHALALAIANWAVHDSLHFAERESAAPLRSRAAVVAELLLSSTPPHDGTIERAKDLGIHLDGSHTVVVIEVGDAAEVIGSDAVREFELVEQITAQALRILQSESPSWHGTAVGRRITFARSLAPGDTTASGGQRLGIVQTVLDTMKQHSTGLVFHCGAGTPHDGIQGLRRSAAEAASALDAAVSRGWSDRVVHTDEMGLRRMLLEISASESSRAQIDDLLQPLDALGPAKSMPLLETLEAYLASEGSLIGAAKRLYLHRNTVVHRINRIKAILASDLTDPDERFTLQLACRVRRLGLAPRP